jgi:hypothetical protein
LTTGPALSAGDSSAGASFVFCELQSFRGNALEVRVRRFPFAHGGIRRPRL